MTDSLGWRLKFAVVAPSTNTSVPPEYDDMRPMGVTNPFSRIAIADTRVTDDASFMVMLNNIRDKTLEGIDDRRDGFGALLRDHRWRGQTAD